MNQTGSSTNVPDIWLAGLVAALEAMAHAPAPSAQAMMAFLRHLDSMTVDSAPATAVDAPETMSEWPTPHHVAQLPLPRMLAATH